MTTDHFDRTSWLAGDQRRFLISADMHYWRVPCDQWRNRLQRLRDSGADCVGLYIPWGLHEREEGVFDFTTYDLAAFLDLAAEIGLTAMVRPGPYIFSELHYGGLPRWLIEGYPEIRAVRGDGSQLKYDVVSYLHPTFLAKAKAWYAAVLPLLVPRQVSRGGPIILVQWDNEVMGPQMWNGALDQHAVGMGVGTEHGPWPEFVRQRRGTLDLANAAYGTTASTFAELRPIERAVGGDLNHHLHRRRLAQDWQDFYCLHLAKYAATLVGWMREAGIDVPTMHNSWALYMNAFLREVHERLGANHLIGCDHYWNLDLDFEQNHPTPKYLAKIAISLGQLSGYGRPATVLEMPGGSLSDWPPTSAHDVLACGLGHLAFGMKSWNTYVFCGGINPPGICHTGEIYDFAACLDPISGEPRPMYASHLRVNAFARAQEWLAGSHRVSDHRLGLWSAMARSERPGADATGLLFAPFAAWTHLRKGCFLTASCAGLSPDFISLDDEEPPTDLPLVVATGSMLPRRDQIRLVSFLERGGRLLLSPVVPTLDEDWQPCRILADAIQAPAQRAYPTDRPVRLTIAGISCVYANGSHFISDEPLGEVEIIARDEATGSTIGWHRRLPGGGAVTMLGVQWRQSHREHERMYTRLLEQLGLRRRLTCDNPNVWPVLRSDGQRSLLFLINPFTEAAHVSVTGDDHAGAFVTGAMTVPGASVTTWTRERGAWAP